MQTKQTSDYTSFIKLLSQQLSIQHSKKVFTTLFFIEFDELSRFNDTLCSNIDDLLMLKISEDLKRLLTDESILSRVDNHQFVIMQKFSSIESVEILAGQIMLMLSEPCFVEELMVYIDASIGISLYPDDGDNAYKLIETAESTMRYTQKSGKNGIGFTKDRVLFTSCEKSIRIMKDLPSAIENGEIYFLYQLQYSHTQKRFVGAEILSRWRHPLYGEVSPEFFIPLAEMSGMVGPLTIRTLIDASKIFDLLETEKIEEFSLSVNISPIFLTSSEFYKTIEFLMKEYNLLGKNLNFEITEGVLLQNTDHLLTTLEKLKSLNIKIELDDFGTGYTSLQHLANFPIDTLKIDKSFIKGVDLDTKKRALIRAIIDMSHALDIDVIAEGVESSSEDSVLQNLGSITVQGYLYSKPTDIDKIVIKLKKHLVS